MMSTIRTLMTSSLLDRLDTRVLLQYVLQVNHAWLIAHAEQTVAEQQEADFLALVARRLQGEPIAYLIGEREFYGLSFTVTPDVLIPRPETELLVDLALTVIPQAQPIRIIDLGTGSGAIAIALAKARPHAKVYATDFSAAALAVAKTNAKRHHVTIHFSQGSWFAAVPTRGFDLIVSNPPYIMNDDSHLTQGDLRFEPRSALTDNSVDGLHALHHIIQHASPYLNQGGSILLELGDNQALPCRNFLDQYGFGQVQSFCDLAGVTRVSTGIWR